MNCFYLLSFYLLRALLLPFSFLPYKIIHIIGRKGGVILYYILKNYRKRTLSNLMLAKELSLTEDQAKKIAKGSIGSLLTTVLEYSKLARENNIERLVTCQNPEIANKILEQGKGVIFFCGHQANWELFFLEGTFRMHGTAIGQAVKNPYLYRWVLQMREKFGGKIVLPSGAVKEGIRSLKQGKFLGIVGDQGMPGTGFSSLFLGREAFTSPLPALLAYKCKVPIITATMKRNLGTYTIHYSDPIYPNLENPMEAEVSSMMQKALAYLENSIKIFPEQWLWQHNRWKQQLLGKIRRKYRQDAIAILLPKEKNKWNELAKELYVFREIYPTEIIYLFTPYPVDNNSFTKTIIYQEDSDFFSMRYHFKLVFNFTQIPCVRSTFLSGSAMSVVDIPSLQKESNCSSTSLSLLLKGAIFHAC